MFFTLCSMPWWSSRARPAYYRSQQTWVVDLVSCPSSCSPSATSTCQETNNDIRKNSFYCLRFTLEREREKHKDTYFVSSLPSTSQRDGANERLGSCTIGQPVHFTKQYWVLMFPEADIKPSNYLQNTKIALICMRHTGVNNFQFTLVNHTIPPTILLYRNTGDRARVWVSTCTFMHSSFDFLDRVWKIAICQRGQWWVWAL